MTKSTSEFLLVKQTPSFNAASSTRDKEAAVYFTSEDFLNAVRTSLQRDLIKEARSYAFMVPKMKVTKSDQPYLDQSLEVLKQTFPELNHMRKCNEGITIDTKPNTFLRRVVVSPTYCTGF